MNAKRRRKKTALASSVNKSSLFANIRSSVWVCVFGGNNKAVYIRVLVWVDECVIDDEGQEKEVHQILLLRDILLLLFRQMVAV